MISMARFISLILIGSALVFSALIVFTEPKTQEFSEKKLEGFLVEERGSTFLSSGNRTNATEALAARLADELEKSEGADINTLTNSLLESALTEPDFSALNIEVPLSALRIINTTSTADEQTYAAAFLATLKKHAAQNIIDGTKPLAKVFTAFAEKYDSLLNELYLLEVPQRLTPFHQEEIRLLTIQQKLFEELLRYEADPFQALVAYQTISELENEIKALQEQYFAPLR